MRILRGNAVREPSAGGLGKIPRHAADFKRVCQPGAHRIVRFEREQVRLVLQPPDGGAENNAPQIVFKFGSVTVGCVGRAGARGADQAGPVHHLQQARLTLNGWIALAGRCFCDFGRKLIRVDLKPGDLPKFSVKAENPAFGARSRDEGYR